METVLSRVTCEVRNSRYPAVDRGANGLVLVERAFGAFCETLLTMSKQVGESRIGTFYALQVSRSKSRCGKKQQARILDDSADRNAFEDHESVHQSWPSSGPLN